MKRQTRLVNAANEHGIGRQVKLRPALHLIPMHVGQQLVCLRVWQPDGAHFSIGQAEGHAQAVLQDGVGLFQHEQLFASREEQV